MEQPTLFELAPAALIYRRPCPPMHKMRCRECHKTGAINGGGSTPAQLDETGGGGYDYAVCNKCFSGNQLARRAGIRGRDIIEIHAIGARS